MQPNQLTLSPPDSKAVRGLNQLTGKLEAELLHDAVEQLVQQAAASNRLTALRQARGMWQHRTVLSNFDQVRSAGWETTLAANE